MTKFKIALFSLVLLQSFNAKPAELTQYVTPANASKAAVVLGASYGAYRMYKAFQARRQARADAKAKEKEEAIRINRNLMLGTYGKSMLSVIDSDQEAFIINKNTVIAFDLHDVVAKYDGLQMAVKGLIYAVPYILLGVWLTTKDSKLAFACYGSLIAMLCVAITKEVLNHASAQEIFENLAQKYPIFKPVFAVMSRQAIDVSAHLKEIKGTVDIAKRLMKNGYKVIFVSNIEPKLWDRFVKDFPLFKDCDAFLPRPEKGWIKKPSEEYFTALKTFLEDKGFAHRNMLFIDDRVKNVVPAIAQGIPSYVFTSPAQLKSDLIEMGADLSEVEGV